VNVPNSADTNPACPSILAKIAQAGNPVNAPETTQELSTGAIAGITVGAVVVVVILVVSVVLVSKSKREAGFTVIDLTKSGALVEPLMV